LGCADVLLFPNSADRLAPTAALKEETAMSVLITLTVPADTEAFRAFAADHPERLTAIADRGREMGAIHHRFGIGNGNVFVVDEWENAEASRVSSKTTRRSPL
jgi:hypothetical protein